MNRRLYRCQHDQRIAGVASGVAEYFDLDPTLVRILWILSIFFGGFGLLLYIAMAIIVPLEPAVGVGQGPDGEGTSSGDPATTQAMVGQPHRHAARGGSGLGATFFGIVLILFGALALADDVLPNWGDRGSFLWPAFILGVGIVLVLMSTRRKPSEQ